MTSKWFERFILAQTALFLLQSVCQNPVYDLPQCSLSAPEAHLIPLATADELRKHTFVRSKTRGESRKRVRRSFHWGSERLSASFQGFVLFKTEDATKGFYPEFVKPEEMDEWTSVFHHRLPALLRKKPWRNLFGTIFARISGDAEHRKGDKKRGQVKFSRLLKVARSHVKAAESDLQRALDDASPNLIAGRRTKLAAAHADLELVVLAKNLVARHYERIVKVSQPSAIDM